ncbi:MMPL family transporter, partial [Vibrio parahaemolyticus]|nr:MMPL family transporter [Vibrio parahaemolyticus]
DKNALFAAAAEFDKGLSQINHFRDVVGKISPQEKQAWASYYFKHRFQLLTTEKRERLSQNPEQQVQHVIQSLYNPFS